MNRRSFLRGIGGVSIALPWLEARAEEANFSHNKRLAWVYMPTGYVPDAFNPKEEGKDYEMTECLSPLSEFREDFNIYSGLAMRGGLGGGGHANCSAFLTDGKGQPGNPHLLAKFSGSADDIISCDQIAAKHLGLKSFINSLHFSSTAHSSERITTGAADLPEYYKYISWKSSTDYVVNDRDPYIAFKRLFGNADSAQVSEQHMQSILDLAKEDLKALLKKSGREDRSRLDQYFTSIRTLEKRMENLKKADFKSSIPISYKKPPAEFAQNLGESWRTTAHYQQLQEMYIDLLVLAFQTNRTRVITYMFAQEATRQNMKFLGPELLNHHSASHFGQSAMHRASFIKIIKYQIGLYAEIIKRLKELKEGDTTVLYNSLIMLSSCIGDGNAHKAYDVPCLVAGNGGGKLETGRHIKFNEHQRLPTSGIHLGMLQAADIPINSFGAADKSLL